MVVVYLAESFEHYGTGVSSTVQNRMKAGLWSVLDTGTNLVSDSTARSGDIYAVMPTGSGKDAANILFGTSLGTVGVAVAARYSSLPGNGLNGFAIRGADSTPLLSWYINPDGSISVYDGFEIGTLLETTEAGIVSANSWHHFEMVATFSTTVGEYELRVDGVAVAQGSALNLGSAQATRLMAGRAGSGSTSPDTHLDDIVIHDGSAFIGPARVITVFPDADGGTQDWTVTGAASGAEAIDETAPDSDTSYIAAPVVNDIAQFTLPTLPSDVDNIVGVYIHAYARQEDAGVSSIKISMISDATEEEGAVHALTPTYVYYGSAFSLDPDGDIVWTKTALEAAIVQIERTV